MVGGGCCLLRLSTKVDGIKQLLDNEEQKVQLCLLLPEYISQSVALIFEVHFKFISEFLNQVYVIYYISTWCCSDAISFL